MKLLSEYQKNLKKVIIERNLCSDPVITGVINDSRLVEKDCIFVAIAGAAKDGHRFIPAAIKHGATTIIHTEPVVYTPGINYLRVNDAYYAYALAMECFLDFPAVNLSLHGITGTKGKTTTAFILEKILRVAGHRCGMISTVKYFDGRIEQSASRTTPSADELITLFRKMHDNLCSDVVMEVSSHGLIQHRPGSAQFQTALFTNLSGDHLDYHLNMENYYQAKKILFDEYLKPDGFMVLNADDESGMRISRECPDRTGILFGRHPNAQCRIENVMLSQDETTFKLCFDGKVFPIRTNLIGEHNVSNITGAFVAAYVAGIKPDTILAALSTPLAVPGRLQQFISPSGVIFFVDYAHTDDALIKVLTILKTIAARRIITVFGCGGDRDRTKRPRMGAAAAMFSDVVILTSDNPRSEDPLAIIAEIKVGIPAGTVLIEEPDRKSAILAATATAQPGDIVLVAGKGHEDYQEQNGAFIHLDDREIIAEICQRQ